MRGFLNMLGMGAGGALIVFSWRISGLLDKTNINTAIWVGGGVLVAIGAFVVIMLAYLAEKRKANDAGRVRTSPRLGSGYSDLRRPQLDVYDTYPVQQGTFLLSDSNSDGGLWS